MARRKIIILGAGISGLSLGWFLKERHGADVDLQIIEKAAHPGGLIRTIQKDGFLFELGPHSIRFSGGGEDTLNLIQEIGLQKELIQADPSSSIRYLFMKNKLARVPNSIRSFLFSPAAKGIMPAIFRDLFAPASKEEDESIEQFFLRRFGRHITNNLVDSFVSGIYAGDIQKLSLRSCFPSLYEWEQRHGSVFKGAFKSKKKKTKSVQGIFSFKHGLQQMTDTLARRLQEYLLFSSEIKAITREKNGVVLTFANGSEIFADHVFSTLSPASLLSLLKLPELQNLLSKIPSAPIATISLGYEQQVLKQKGFGYLIPSQENEKILGVIWSSLLFPAQNQQPQETRLTVMIGGAREKKISQYSESDFLSMAQEALDRHLGISREPCSSHITQYPQAIPQYLIGHTLRLQAIESLLAHHFPSMTLHGNGYYGISINDCIRRSKILSCQ